MKTVRTRSQEYSERAWQYYPPDKKGNDEFVSRARSFPSLLHNSGLAQAVAFVLGKDEKDFVGYLEKVLNVNSLYEQARKAPLREYMLLSRKVMLAATWIKRTVDAREGGN